ncbi:MAG: hypothetical protein EOP51_27935, partial [Sphingobacteriales bacterium]
MKFIKTLFFLLVLQAAAVAQLPIAFYDFENSGNRNNFENSVKLAVNAGATAFTVANSTITNGNGAGNSKGGLQSGKSLGVYRGMSTNSTDLRSAASSYVQFKVNTNGFTGISLEFDVLANSFNSPYYGVNYSTNGTTWYWIGSVTTPGSGNSFPWPNFFGIPYWATANCTLPSQADNANNLYIRIYNYYSGSNAASAQLRFDNVQVKAMGTVAGASKTMLDDRDIFTNTTSGLLGVLNSALSIKRSEFKVSGAGTNISIPYLDLGANGSQAGNLTIENNA